MVAKPSLHFVQERRIILADFTPELQKGPSPENGVKSVVCHHIKPL
jgi:hypothetical protein